MIPDPIIRPLIDRTGMLRQRLVRQSAVNISSGSDNSSSTTSMPSPPPLRRRRASQDCTKMYRQLSSESLDNLLTAAPCPPSPEFGRRAPGQRRHSVACGVLYVDLNKPTLKSAFNSAVRRMSDACSMLSFAPSSTYNLSSPSGNSPSGKKRDSGNEALFPQVLTTFRQDHQPKPQPDPAQFKRGHFAINRRFSTDCPPPSYNEATCGWKQTAAPPKQKLLTRQHEVVSKSSLVALEDDDRL